MVIEQGAVRVAKKFGAPAHNNWKKCLFDKWRSKVRQCQVFAEIQMMEIQMMRMTY